MNQNAILAVVDDVNRIVATAYGEAVLNYNTFERDGKIAVEMHLKTGITGEELSQLQEEYEFLEMYGMDAIHFHENPESSAELGLILLADY